MSKKITSYFTFEPRSSDILTPILSELSSTPADKRKFSSSSPTSDQDDLTPKRAFHQESPSNMTGAGENQWIRDALQEIKAELKALASAEDVRKLASEFKEQIAKLEGTIFELCSEISSVKAENKALRDRVNDLESGINSLEQYGRRTNIRIFNLKENKGESSEMCRKKCCELFTEIGVATKEADLEAAHRVGRETDGRNRPIIVRFLDRRQRDRVLDNRRKLKGKRVAISEDLTAANYSLERAAYKHSATAATWTSKGKVFAKLKNGIKKKSCSNLEKTWMID